MSLCKYTVPVVLVEYTRKTPFATVTLLVNVLAPAVKVDADMAPLLVIEDAEIAPGDVNFVQVTSPSDVTPALSDPVVVMFVASASMPARASILAEEITRSVAFR